MTRRLLCAVLAASLCAAAQPALAQTLAADSIVGMWSSTLKGFDHSISPPLDYEENVVMTISANGNIYIERTRRPLKAKGSVSWTAGGVYTVPAPGILRLTFSNNLGELPATWTYQLKGDFLKITDAGGVSRTFNRVHTAI